MKINKFYKIVIIFSILVSSCTSVTEGLTGKKRSKTSDEFFVQKKSPLVMPPDFDDMPLPKPLMGNQEKTDDSNIEDLLSVYKEEDQTKNSKSEGESSLEKSILKKINNN